MRPVAPQVGAAVARHWNLPEETVAAIRYHHSPRLAPDAFRNLVCLVYVANAFCDIEDGSLDVSLLDRMALRTLGVADIEGARALHKKIQSEN